MISKESDKQILIQNFIKNFVLKERRERSLFELTHPQKRNLFTKRLNHSWASIIDARKLTLIPKAASDFEYIKDNLKFKDASSVYVLSEYDDIDDTTMEFRIAFDKCWGRGLASLLISEDASKLYLETEQTQGAPDRFIGRVVQY